MEASLPREPIENLSDSESSYTNITIKIDWWEFELEDDSSLTKGERSLLSIIYKLMGWLFILAMVK